MYYKELQRNELPVPEGMQTETDCPVSRDAAEVISTSFGWPVSSLLSPETLSERGVGTGRKKPPLRERVKLGRHSCGRAPRSAALGSVSRV